MKRAECNRNCWISAAIAGVVVLLFVSGIGELNWVAGLFLGLITTLLFGALMVWLVCHDMPLPLPPLEATPPQDWRRVQADSQPQALLVAATLAEQPSPVQMAVRAAELSDDAPADDLRRIKGIGPKISDWLNAEGVTRYDQIAGWDAAKVTDFAHRMGRMGSRIESDDWVGQAKVLAAGGQTDHSRRVDKGDAT